MFTAMISADVKCAVSILPETTFLKKIGGDKVSIILMVSPGNSPHTYEPKPSQLIALSQVNVYFSIGVEFEQAWLDKFKSISPNMMVADVSKGIEKIDIVENNHEHKKETEAKDPHVWTSPSNVKIIAKNIYETLISVDANNTEYYKANYRLFLEEIAETKKKIEHILASRIGNKTFMVFHPSWGYFAKEFNLKQLSVEIEGKSPKPKELITLMVTAKKNHISAIVAQPEFSDSAAQIIAKELNINVVKISPLNKKWGQNLLLIAKTIVGKQ